MRTYDKLIETISARQGTGNLRPRFGNAMKSRTGPMRTGPDHRKKTTSLPA